METLATFEEEVVEQDLLRFKPCSRCNSTNYYITLDRRGVPEVRCAECDSQVSKTSAAAMWQYHLQEVDRIYKEQEDHGASMPPCKYCTERWAILTGRVGTQPRPMNDIKYCPMCGRKLLPEDRKY